MLRRQGSAATRVPAAAATMGWGVPARGAASAVPRTRPSGFFYVLGVGTRTSPPVYTESAGLLVMPVLSYLVYGRLLLHTCLSFNLE